MITVLLGLVLTATLVAVCLALVWPGHGDSALDTRLGKAPSATKPVKNRRPDSLEGVLVWQLELGQITRLQYLRAMSDLAERDAAQHPLEVPRD